MKMTIWQIRSDSGLAVTLRIAVSRLVRRSRAEPAARGLPELSGTLLAALVRRATMTPGKPAGHEKVQPPSMTRIIAVLEDRAPHSADQWRVTATAGRRDLVGQVRMVREAWLTRQLREQRSPERSVLRAAAPMLGKVSQS